MSAERRRTPRCRGVGDLVLVYKRVTALAGHTSRVAELLEAVARMSAPNASSYHREVMPLATARAASGCRAYQVRLQ